MISQLDVRLRIHPRLSSRSRCLCVRSYWMSGGEWVNAARSIPALRDGLALFGTVLLFPLGGKDEKDKAER